VALPKTIIELHTYTRVNAYVGGLSLGHPADAVCDTGDGPTKVGPMIHRYITDIVELFCSIVFASVLAGCHTVARLNAT
jgi:hypothetical protein